MRFFYIWIILLSAGLLWQCNPAKMTKKQQAKDSLWVEILPAGKHRLQSGAEQFLQYLPLLEGKRVGLVVNHTARIGHKHLLDTLLARGVQVQKIFVPEHGFRGEADAGENIDNSYDRTTGLPIVSLYGNQKKPSQAHLADIDLVLFDIQDVGARFYTYISTLHYVMEACAEQQKQLLVLDRPNPHGDYTDGPVLKKEFASFVGLHPIPVVYGLTMAELANMINGEGWLAGSRQCPLLIVPMRHYERSKRYSLPLPPSPNLPNDQAIALYPSLCFFEGTIISVGRGTPFPFQVLGYPHKAFGNFEFRPQPGKGAKKPLYDNQLCYGIDLRQVAVERRLDLGYLIDFYQKAPDKKQFFNNFFDKLAGNSTLRQQIIAGLSEEQIRASWQKDLEAYRKMRQQYLIYP
jgi:uncharacterized protein YbbC (DUF1343 family)